MDPDLIFWSGLVVKMVLTATVVVIASVAAERSGPFIGALIAALPTSAGSAYVILALEHDADFLAMSAVGSLAANAAVAIFALIYAALAQRHGVMLSVGAALVVWFGVISAFQLAHWTAASALALNAAVLAVTIPASARYRHDRLPSPAAARTRWDIPLRAAAVALVVATVTTASHWIGSFVSGTLAVFPIVMCSFVVILQPRVGGTTAAAVLAHAQIPLIGLGLGFVGIHYVAPWAGSWWALAAGLAITVAWSGALWLIRRGRLRRTIRA
jgi:uncharacterized membrane protein (GlpM family)